MKIFPIYFCIFCFVSHWTFFALSKDTHASLKSQKNVQKIKQLKKRRSPLLSKSSNKKFSRIHKLMGKKGKESNQQAIALLEKIIQSPISQDFEKAQALLLLGHVLAATEQYKKSVSAYKRALAIEQLPYHQHIEALMQLSHLHLVLEHPNMAHQYLQQCFELFEKPKPQAHFFMAHIYYMKNQKKEALKEVQTACNITNKPQKQWLTLLAYLHLEMDNYDNAESVFHRSLTLYPASDDHWKGFGSAKMSNKKTSEALVAFQMADKITPFKDESHIGQMASLLSAEGIPYQSGTIWERAIKNKIIKANQKNYEILGDLWRQARETERSLQAYRTSSSLVHSNPKIFFKLGQVYLERAEWQLSIQAMEKILTMDHAENLDRVYFQIALSYYELKNCTKSLEFFRKAETIEGQYDIPARQWIRKLKKECSQGMVV